MKYNNSRRNIILPLVGAACLAIGIIAGMRMKTSPGFTITGGVPQKAASNKLEGVLSLIKTQYVDVVNMDSIAEKVLPVLLENLDPHSTYITAAELADLNEPLEGQFDGIGVTFNMMTDTVVVLSVINGGPSAKSGIMVGDRIISVNDTLIAGQKLNQNDVVKKLRGARGSKVGLGINRQGIAELLNIEVTRGIIPVKSLDAYFMLDGETGLIKLSRFSRNSYQEIITAISSLKSQGMKKLVFDLRGNTGGFLDQAILITNEFLPAGSLIVYTDGVHRKREEQYSNGNGRLVEIPLAVLIDEGSASASEIVAGALQDNDRGTIIGRRSFGKGLVQEQIPLKDGSAVRLTVARYYTPVGRSIQKPYDNGIEKYNSELETRFTHNEFFTADSIHFIDSLKFTTPKGKVVYGGGGIMPDIFVPADTTGYNRYVRQIFGRNIMFTYSIRYSDKHRAQLEKISDFGKLDAYFSENKSRIFSDFVAYAASKGVKPEGREMEECRELLEAELKADIGRFTPLEDNGYYYSIFEIDKVIKKTIIFLHNDVTE